MDLNIQKVAGEAADGTFFVKTEGLQSHGHAELEIVGIPSAAVDAAASLINFVIEGVIEKKGARLQAGENVGLPLAVGGHEEFPAVWVGVQAAESAPASGGIFAKLRGAATHGVIRLLDLPGARSGPPLAALASMMLYRSNCRSALGDVGGAIAELRTGIEMTPGDSTVGPPPRLDTGGAQLNWQNHASYLRLAELIEPDKSSAVYMDVYSRFAWLALHDIGCPLAVWRVPSDASLVEQALHIIARNVAQPRLAAGPTAGLRFVASPVWTLREDGLSVREASMIPAGLVDYYFGGRLAASEVADALARLSAECVMRHANEPWKISRMTKLARGLYSGCGPAVPALEVIGPAQPTWLLLSAVIAEATRYVQAEATVEELRSVFGLTDGPARVPESLAAKLYALEVWETREFTTAIGPS